VHDAQLAVAIDFGGTKVESAVIVSDGTIVPGSRFRAPTGRDASADEVAASVVAVALDAAAVAHADGREVVGVGIGTAGPIDAAAGTASPLNVPSWHDYPLRRLVESTVAPLLGDVPVVMRIDGEAIALAEFWVGAAQGATSLLGMVVSTGIGGGLILDGRTVPGPSGNAGHIGHVGVGGATERCACGMIGCVEAVASGPNTVAWARSQGWAGSTGEELAAACAAGDELALTAVRRSAHAIGRAIAGATALLDIEIVAIGGGFSSVVPDYIDLVAQPIAESEFPFVRSVSVVRSGLSGDGPLIGAAGFVLLPQRLGSTA
jgi:glucokinase